MRFDQCHLISIQVAILWRMERNHLSFEWLRFGFNVKDQAVSERELEERVNSLLNSGDSLAFKTVLPEFYNEHSLVRPYIYLRNIKLVVIYCLVICRVSIDNNTMLFIFISIVMMTQLHPMDPEPILGTAILRKDQLQPVEWESVACRLIMHSSCLLT